jgi:hypothetical protein
VLPTREELAVILGVGRSCLVLQGFRAEGILDTGRATVTVRNIGLLHRKSSRRACAASRWRTDQRAPGIDWRLRPHSAHTRSITGVRTEALPVTGSVGLPP